MTVAPLDLKKLKKNSERRKLKSQDSKNTKTGRNSTRSVGDKRASPNESRNSLLNQNSSKLLINKNSKSK